MHAIIFDFDGTIADGFSPSPNNIGIHEIHRIVIRQMFGDSALTFFEESLGGLQNREPSELIHLLLGGDDRDALDKFISLKMDYFLPEISPFWPRLSSGFKELWMEIAEGTIPVETAIVSSGHDAFIKKVFETNGLPTPKILITSDTTKNLGEPNGRRPLHKPHSHMLARAHYDLIKDAIWEDHEAWISAEDRYTGRNLWKGNIMYVGDDPSKDLVLAGNARIIGGFVPFSNKEFQPDLQKGQVLIPSFHWLSAHLHEHKDDFARGKSMAEIMLGISDKELFPPSPRLEREFATRQERW